MKHNILVRKIAQRARQLASYRRDELLGMTLARVQRNVNHGSGAIQAQHRKSSPELIEEILCHEFCKD